MSSPRDYAIVYALPLAFATIPGAFAADLGMKKASVIEYVKTCPTYGVGFFVVPGATSCLKLIGRVRWPRAV
jgi:hypothetical protein